MSPVLFPMESLYPHHLAKQWDQLPPIAILDSAAVARSPRSLQVALDALGVASAEAQQLPSAITSASRMATDATQRVYIALPWDYAGQQPCAPLGFLKVGQRALYLAVPSRAAHCGPVPDPSTLVASLAARSSGGGGGAEGGRGQRGRGAEGGRRLGGAGSMWECNPLCVLDFYVEAGARRRGVGRALLDCMMRSEGVAHPAVLAYVRAPAAAFFEAGSMLL